MIFALLVAATTCATAWYLTGSQKQRPLGAAFGLIDSLLWLIAGVDTGKPAVVGVAAFCALCFARALLHTFAHSRVRRKHAN